MILDKMKLDGKVAVVTGGTSGIGLAIVQAFAEAGAAVIPVSRSREKVARAAAEVKNIGARTLEVTADVSKPEEVSSLAARVLAEFGKIDILVNNAGTAVKKPFLEQTWEDWKRVMDLNLNAIFFCCKVMGSHMVERRQGNIINVASIGSRCAITKSLPYCVSKGGLLQLTRTLSSEWAPYNIRVNAIAPAYIVTPMVQGMLEDKELYQRIISRIPMGRLGNADEVQGAAVFLASEASSFITGEVIFIDGGFSNNTL